MIRTRMRSLLPLLALSTSLAMATSARAQDRHDQGPGDASVSIQIDFGRSPHWVGVHGTHVKEIRANERPDYDMFNCGGRYYVFKDSRWYVNRRAKGRFVVIDDRDVPSELSRVPRDHWHNYPNGWSDDRGDRGKGKDKDKGDRGKDKDRGRGHGEGH